MQGIIAGRNRRHRVVEAPTVLASDIDFLKTQGVAPNLLAEAESLARHEGCPASSCLIAHDLLDEAVFYRLLARHLGLRLCEEMVRPAATTQLDQALADGFLELEAGSTTRWLLAPQGPDIAIVLAARHQLREAGAAFAIVTPQRLTMLLYEYFEKDISRDASHDLARHLPAMCNAPGPTPGSTASPRYLRSSSAVLLGGAVSALLGISFVISNWLKLSACLAPRPAPRAPDTIAAHELPTYTIIVALYHEHEVVADLAAALEAIAYPRSRLAVLFVIEADDDRTRHALLALDLPQRFTILTAPAGTPRTKPRALNVALRLVRSDYVTIFDAEDRPSPTQLRAAAERFAQLDDRIACLQASLVIDNADESWLTRLFALDYATLFDVINPFLASANMVMPLGGTSNHFRVAALKACHGWDAWNVTEDADLGIRLARLGYGLASLTSDTGEEAPVTFKAWLHQRRRWQKGWMQTALVHLRFPQALVNDLGPARATMAASWLATMVLGPLFGPFLALACLLHVESHGFFRPESTSAVLVNTWISFVALTGAFALRTPLLIGLWRRRLWSSLIIVPLLPLYLGLVTLAAWLALHDLIVAPYHWRKTTHGIARMRRAPAL